MQMIRWSNELELGIAKIDNQHKQLINIINELSIVVEYNQSNSSLIPILERLAAYAHTHFKEEEDIFEKYDYIDRLEHEAEHAVFIDKIKYIRKMSDLMDSPMSANVKDFLLSWLWSHIKTRDLEYKLFIDNKEQLSLESK
jgi:hemerythrin-like metal-binding protein